MPFVINPFTGEFDAVTDPFQEPFIFPATCLPSDGVGQCVYVSGDSVGGVTQVTAANPASITTMPAVGIIISKGTPTTCVVAFFGIITSSGLSPNARYFVDVNGYPTSSVPTARPVIIQVLGQAVDSTRLLLTPSKDLVKLLS